MADKYIYAVARIRALEMTLMSQAVIEQLVATDSYKKAVQFIIEKGWGDSDKASMDENDILRAETDKTWAAVGLWAIWSKCSYLFLEKSINASIVHQPVPFMNIGLPLMTNVQL